MPPRYLPRHHLRCRRPLGRRAAGAAAAPDPGQWPALDAAPKRTGRETWWFHMEKWWFYMENRGFIWNNWGFIWKNVDVTWKNVFSSWFFEETCGFWYSWPREIGIWLVFFHLEPWKMVMLSGKLGSKRDELGFMGEKSGGLTRFQHECKS